jgi:hypothetical protein
MSRNPLEVFKRWKEGLTLLSKASSSKSVPDTPGYGLRKLVEGVEPVVE